MSENYRPTTCCGYTCSEDAPHPVMWNPYNEVIQCHNCGHQYEPIKKLEAGEAIKRAWSVIRDAWNRMNTIRESNPEIYLESDMKCLRDEIPHLGYHYTDDEVNRALAGFRGTFIDMSPPTPSEETGYWKSRALCAEDLIECVRTWHETIPHMRRLEQLQSAVVGLRRTFKRPGAPDVCGELMPVCPDDSWIAVEERKPTLATPIVEVLFANGEIAESKFWTGYFEHDFQRFETARPDSAVTHWRPKEGEGEG